MLSLRTLLISLFVVATYLLTFVAGFSTHFLMERMAVFGIYLGGPALISPATSGPTPILHEAWQIVDSVFLGEIPSQQERTYGAIRGLVDTLADPYTIFIEPQPRQLERDELRGEFGGIGVYIQPNEDGEIALRPIEALAASEAGIRVGDILSAVDGQPVPPATPTDDIALMIRGQVGTKVLLTVRREGETAPLTFEITRQRIETPSLEWRILEDAPGVGYISIHIFNERTNQELLKAIRDLNEQGMDRLLLDLRHNPGGLVDAAVDVTSQFLKDGIVFVQVERNQRETSHSVRSGGIATEIPLLVLVDGSTASAAEIVAGALQDAGRVRLIGERTFGKGSVQLVRDLSDNSSLHVTTAQWYTPSRRQIDKTGLQPDVEIAQAADEDIHNGHDPILEGAIQQFPG